MQTRTLSELAALVSAQVEGDGSRRVRGPAGLAEAGPEEVSFLAHPRYQAELAATRAAGVLVGQGVAAPRPGPTLLRCADPQRAMSDVIRAFAAPRLRPVAGVDARAIVDPTASIAAGASIGAGAIVGAGARIGARSVIHSGAVIGAQAAVGEDCELFPGAVLYARVCVGNRVVIHAGTVLGSDGFGFDPTPQGWDKVPQCGTVVVEDDVEIGANCTVDCARFGATRIGRGAKLDNLVQIGHNVQIGAHALIVAQSAVAGSSRIGSWAVLAGQTAVGGHLTIGERARVAGQSGVGRDVEPGEDVGGTPAMPQRLWIRNQARYQRLDEMAGELRRLQKRVAELEAHAGAGRGAACGPSAAGGGAQP